MNRAVLLVSLFFASVLLPSAQAAVAAKQSGSKLFVKSGTTADLIELEGNGAIGELTLRLNGVASTVTGVRDIRIHGGDGDDVVLVSGIEIGGSLTAKLGGGGDRFELDCETTVERAVVIGGKLEIDMGGQDDDVSDVISTPGRGIAIGGNVSVKNTTRFMLLGAGGTAGIDVGDVTVGGNLRVVLADSKASAKAGIEIFMRDVNVGGATKLDTSSGTDLVSIELSLFSGAFSAKLGSVLDTVDFGATASKFDTSCAIDGQADGAVIFGLANTECVVPVVLENIEK